MIYIICFSISVLFAYFDTRDEQKKNIGIFEIKVNSNNNSFQSYNKSKSLSKKINLENSPDNNINNNNKNEPINKSFKKSNSNYNFLNVNLCKDKENVAVVFINGGKVNFKDNSSINLRSKNLK